jgi:phage terminase large subunit
MPGVVFNKVYKQLFDTHNELRSDCRYFEVYGGRRSAKSHDVCQAICITAQSQPGHFIPLMRKVGDTCRDSIFAQYCNFFYEKGIGIHVNNTNMEITLNNGSRFRGFGCDNPEKLKSLVGATMFHLEESNEFDEEDFDSLDAGLSPAKYPARIFMTHNPVPQIPGSMYWFQRRFLQHPHELSKAVTFDTPTGRAFVLRTWYKDNAFCPEATKKVLEGYKETNPEKYKLWALGEFTKITGAAYKSWDIVPEVPPEVLPESAGIGLDFGFSNDPTAALRIWIRESTHEIWIKQILYMTDLYPEMIYDKLCYAGVTPEDSIIADSARPDIISKLYDMGLAGIVGVTKHTGYKEEAVNQLQAYKIHIVEGGTDAIREFSTVCWARDKTDKPLPKLQDGDDHTTDCLEMLFSMSRHSLSILDVL